MYKVALKKRIVQRKELFYPFSHIKRQRHIVSARLRAKSFIVSRKRARLKSR